MIIVHHLNNSRSQRLLWLLEELGLEYRIERYLRDPRTLLAPPALKQIHPLGKSPVIDDGGRIVAESGCIIEYLIECHGGGRLRPAAEHPDRWRYCYWLHYAEGSAMTPLLLKLVFDRIESGPMPFFVRPIAKAIAGRVKREFVLPQIATHLNYLESELADRDWFAGAEFSAADVQMSFPLEAAAARAGLDQRYPNLQRFLARIQQRPAYQRALQRAGDYSIAQ